MKNITDTYRNTNTLKYKHGAHTTNASKTNTEYKIGYIYELTH